MHIAFIIPDTRGGGAQKMMINLANEIVRAGHQVDLIILNKTGDYNNLISPKIRTIDLKKKRALHAIPALISYIRTDQPDVALSALFHVNLTIIISKILSFSKSTKIIISERNHLSLCLSEMKAVKKTILLTLIKFLYPFAHKIISISDGVKEDLKNIISSKINIQTIYNPVVTHDFENQEKQILPDIFPKTCGLKLITSGRLVNQKDYPTLLKALSIYRQKHGDAHLVILGEGTLLQELQSLSKELELESNVSFVGFTETPLAYMKQADIFVISSAWEGFCNVIVEALYAGLKVVATDCPSGPAEILNQGEYGELAIVGNPENLAKKIAVATKKKNDHNRQRNRALEFTSEKKSQEFLMIFKEVLSNEK